MVSVTPSGGCVILTNGRRPSKWRATDGVALSGVARYGIVPSYSIIEAMVDEIAWVGVVELIPTTTEAQESIDAA